MMTTENDTLRAHMGLWLMVGLLCLLPTSGCQFDSSLEDVRCEEEGARSDGRICRDGFWVADELADVSDAPEDTPEQDTDPDVEPDTRPDTPISDTDDDSVSDSDDPDTEDGGDCDDEETRCDGMDDDCDGEVDEAFPNKGSRCQTGSGPCRATGEWVCNASQDGLECNASPPQGSTEICDGVDNDCDGDTDEGVETVYYRDADHDSYGRDDDTQRACAPAGEYTALRGNDCDDANPAVNPSMSDVCGNRTDDDCDGVTDEGCRCDYRNTDTGVCAMGSVDATTGECTAPATYQQPEQDCSDGLDNNCNGRIDTDAGCPCLFISPVGVCGYSTYSANGQCQQTDHYESTESTCGDARDNDCDGLTDCMDPDCPGACRGENCGGHGDCASNYCNPAGECGLTQCGNNVRDPNEVLADCGAPPCLRCRGGSCSGDDDCKSLDCDMMAGTCN